MELEVGELRQAGRGRCESEAGGSGRRLSEAANDCHIRGACLAARHLLLGDRGQKGRHELPGAR